LFGDLGGQGRHFRLILAECRVCHPGDLVRCNVDAEALERERILFGRQPEVGARLGQDVLSHPQVVFGQFALQPRIGLFPTRQFVLLEQVRDAFGVIRIAPKFGFHFIPGWIQYAGLGKLFQGALFEQRRKGFVPALRSGVLAQSDDGIGPAFRRDLVVEQSAQPLEDDLAGVDERHQVLSLEIFGTEPQVEGLAQNLQILCNVLVGLRGASRLEICQDRDLFGALREFIGQRGITDALVVFGEPLLRSLFGRMLEFHGQQALRIFVALLHPVFGLHCAEANDAQENGG
jgi:hypothetical protein